MPASSSSKHAVPAAAQRGRPREYDIDEVAARAADVFWKHGYHATSIEALCQATGLQRGSLYGAFGDKQGVLAAAFDRYAQGALVALQERLCAAGPPRQVLREALLHYTRVAARLSGRHGCFITNATLELLPEEAALRPHIERTLQRIASLFAATIVRGQHAGTFDAGLDEQAVGNYLLCIVQGLRVLGKASLAEHELVQIVDLALRVLG